MYLSRLSAVALLAAALPSAAFAATVVNPVAELVPSFSYNPTSGQTFMSWGGTQATYQADTTTDFQNWMVSNGVTVSYVTTPTYRLDHIAAVGTPADGNCSKVLNLANPSHLTSWSDTDLACIFATVPIVQNTLGVPDDGLNLRLIVNWVHMTPAPTNYSETYLITSTTLPRAFKAAIIGSVQAYPSPSGFYRSAYTGTSEPITFTLLNYANRVLDTRSCTLVSGLHLTCP